MTILYYLVFSILQMTILYYLVFSILQMTILYCLVFSILQEGKEMFYLTMHSTHFIYGYISRFYTTDDNIVLFYFFYTADDSIVLFSFFYTADDSIVLLSCYSFTETVKCCFLYKCSLCCTIWCFLHCRWQYYVY